MNDRRLRLLAPLLQATSGGGGGGGAGTVTSVNASGGTTGFAFTGGPISVSGTLTLTVSNAATVRSSLGLATVASSGLASDLTGTLANAQLAAFTGDITKTAGSGVTVLATVNANTGTFGGAATVPQFSVNGKGLITGVTAIAIAIPFSQLTSVPTTLAGHNITLTSGDVTGALGYTPTSVTGLTGAQTVAAFKTGLSLVKADVGLGSVDNTADAAKNVLTATKFVTSRTIGMTGDVVWSSGAFDGSGNVTAAAAIQPGVVTLAMQANMATASVVYRKTAGAGAPEVQSLATLKTDLGLTGTNSGDQTITLTGPITGSGTSSFATSVTANAITDAMLAQMATASFKGRTTAGTGNVEVLTATQATALLNTFTATLKGLVPPPTTSTGKFLKDDGTWATIAGGGDMLKANNLSDVVSVSSARTNLGLGTAATINTGTSGATIPLLNAANTFGDVQTFSGSGGGFNLADRAAVPVGNWYVSNYAGTINFGFGGAAASVTIDQFGQIVATALTVATTSALTAGYFVTSGTNAGLTLVPRDASGANWLALNNTGIFRLYNGTDKLTLDASGNLVVVGTVAGTNITTGGNTTGNSATATKLATSRNIAITGDLAWNVTFDGSAAVTAAGTLATVNSTVGSFGSATQVATFTVNAKGLTTAAGNVTITPAVGSITGLGTGVGAALAIAVGSAGAPILFNGAGGTPTSLTLTNATGLPEAGVTNLVTDLAAKAPLTNPQFLGTAFFAQPAPTALTATATLTIAQILTLIIQVTSAAAVSLTLPTGTLTDAGLVAGALAVNEAFEWYVINTGSTSGAVTMVAGATHSIVGNAVTAISTTSRWLTRKTAANTFVTYRIA